MSSLAQRTAVQLSPMTRAEAESWVADVRTKGEAFALALKKGEERFAWRALGYDSMQECCIGEFGVTRQRIGQILGQVQTAMDLEEAVNSALPPGAGPVQVIPIFGRRPHDRGETYVAPHDVSAGQVPDSASASSPAITITDREARAARPRIEAVTESVRRRVSHGTDPAEAVREAIKEHAPSVTHAPLCGAVHGDARCDLEPDHAGDHHGWAEVTWKDFAGPIKTTPAKPAPSMPPTAASSNASRPSCPPGCKEPAVFRFGHWVCKKHG